jgi:hypothetical protein
MKRKPKVGDYTGVRMASGSYKVCRILDTYEPGETKIFCGNPYTNKHDHTTYYLDWGGISTPIVFFRSKREADIWALTHELAAVKEELELERARHKKARDNISSVLQSLTDILRRQ